MSGRESTAGCRRIAIAVGLIGFGLGVGFALRYFLVQAPELAWACGATAKPWWCGLREGVISVFRWQGLGLIAVVAGALALFRRGSAANTRTRAAGVALMTGAAGLLLYAPELSAAGLLLGSLRTARS